MVKKRQWVMSQMCGKSGIERKACIMECTPVMDKTVFIKIGLVMVRLHNAVFPLPAAWAYLDCSVHNTVTLDCYNCSIIKKEEIKCKYINQLVNHIINH